MGDIAKIAHFTHNTIIKHLRPSAEAAAAQCTGGDTGTYCGTKWTTGSYDGTMGVGQQMSAWKWCRLIYWMGWKGRLLIGREDPARGAVPQAQANPIPEIPDQLDAIVKRDKVGAGILTAVVAILIIECATFMVF